MVKKMIAGAAALVLALSAAGCGAAKNDAGFMSAAQKYEAWRDIPLDTVIAKLHTGEEPEAFEITFGEFLSEYLYYLSSYNIDDDMSDEYKDECAGYRTDIITFLTYERIFLHEAKTVYGITEDSLTGEQKQEILDNSNEVFENWKNYYLGEVAELYGDDISGEEKDKAAEKMLLDDLSGCGYTKDIFYKWEYSAYVQNLLIDAINSKAEVSDDEVYEMYEQYRGAAEDAYNNDKAAYEYSALYPSLYVPDGTRRSEHIFFPYIFDEEREDDSDAESGSADTVTETVAEAQNRLSNGEEFSALQDEYSADDSGEYIVIRDSVLFPTEYVNALYGLRSVGDISEPVMCEDGVYLIRYSSDARVSAEETEHIKEDMRSYIMETKQNELESEQYNDWMSRYEYDIDYALLRISDPDEEVSDAEHDNDNDGFDVFDDGILDIEAADGEMFDIDFSEGNFIID